MKNSRHPTSKGDMLKRIFFDAQTQIENVQEFKGEYLVGKVKCTILKTKKAALF